MEELNQKQDRIDEGIRERKKRGRGQSKMLRILGIEIKVHLENLCTIYSIYMIQCCINGKLYFI
jgi:hypothetical protein